MSEPDEENDRLLWDFGSFSRKQKRKEGEPPERSTPIPTTAILVGLGLFTLAAINGTFWLLLLQHFTRSMEDDITIVWIAVPVIVFTAFLAALLIWKDVTGIRKTLDV